MDVSSSVWITSMVVLLVILAALAIVVGLRMMKSAQLSRQERAEKAARRMAHAPAEEFVAER